MFRQDEFGGDGVDLYDDIGGPTEAAASGGGGGGTPSADGAAGPGSGESASSGTGGPNGVYHQSGGSLTPTMNRRYQLYVGNLTWWTTDQDIANALRDIGVNDLQEVKFFENRANGQSKGFSVISLGSESSLRSVLDQLPKVEMHGQAPVVTYPSKQALTQFESLQKTRPVPPPQQNGPPRGPAPPNMSGGPMSSHPGGPQGGGPPGHPPRSMQPIMQPGQYRPQHMSQVPQVGGPNSGPPRMQVCIRSIIIIEIVPFRPSVSYLNRHTHTFYYFPYSIKIVLNAKIDIFFGFVKARFFFKLALSM